MPTPLQSPSVWQALLDQADIWLVRLGDGEPSESLKREFSAWLATSTLHRQAFDQQLALYQSLGQLRGLSLSELSPRRAVSSAAAVTPAPRERRWALPLAASLASLLLLAVVLPLLHSSASHAPAALLYATAPGEQRSIALADGSVVRLNTNSSVAVNFSAAERALTLVRGEAYFEVAKDPARPFVVNLGAAQVTAVGTAFNIRRRGAHSAVQVTEGIVAATSDSGYHRQIEAGHRFALQLNGVTELAPDTSAPDWLDGNLDFDQRPLKQVVAELNRYLERPVSVELDAAHASQPVSGHFELRQPESVLELLVASFDLQLVDEAGTRRLIAR